MALNNTAPNRSTVQFLVLSGTQFSVNVENIRGKRVVGVRAPFGVIGTVYWMLHGMAEDETLLRLFDDSGVIVTFTYTGGGQNSVPTPQALGADILRFVANQIQPVDTLYDVILA